jgi:transposase-like protein
MGHELIFVKDAKGQRHALPAHVETTAEAHRNRQTRLLRRRQARGHAERRSHKGLNNRADNSHVPIRKRERMMQGFRLWLGLQRFVSAFSSFRNHFVPPRSYSSLSTHLAMAEWKSITAAA